MAATSATHPTDFVLRHRFDDFEAFAEAARGWDLDFLQLDRGRFDASLTHVVTDEVMLTECTLGRKVEHRGTPPKGYQTVAISALDGLFLRWKGTDLGPRDLLLLPIGGELEGVSRPGFHAFAVSVSQDVLTEAALRHKLSSVGELFPSGEVVRCSNAAVGDLHDLTTHILRAVESRPSLLEDGLFRRLLHEELVDGVLDAIAAGELSRRGPPIASSRSRALKKALAAIADRAHEPLTVAELERLSGASSRTLRYAFEEEFGMPPKQYLQAYRLNQVRRALRRSSGAPAAVSDAANQWGFWHLGQFARDYRRMFGELPSETIRGQ